MSHLSEYACWVLGVHFAGSSDVVIEDEIETL